MKNKKRNWKTIELPTFKVVWTPDLKFSNKDILAGAGRLIKMEAVTEDKAHQIAQKLNHEGFKNKMRSHFRGGYKIINMEWEASS